MGVLIVHVDTAQESGLSRMCLLAQVQVYILVCMRKKVMNPMNSQRSYYSNDLMWQQIDSSTLRYR